MSNRTTFFARWALPILVVVFFLVPFALRGARFAVQRMKNDVKDWLPSDYQETTELDWFRKNFISEQFVIVTWNDCFGDEKDERYKLFVAKLAPETPPSMLQPKVEEAAEVEEVTTSISSGEGPVSPGSGLGLPIAKNDATGEEVGISNPSLPPGAIPAPEAPLIGIANPQLPPSAIPEPELPSGAIPAPLPELAEDGSEATEQETTITNPTRILARPNFIGDLYGLHTDGNYYEDWGRREEKWIKGAIYRADSAGKTQVAEDKWFYITPTGDLYLWNTVDSPVAALWRAFWHSRSEEQVSGELLHSFGEVDGPWYYANPKRLRAQLFKSVTTGPDVRDNLIREGGVLENDPEEAARRLAGTLFGPDGKQTCIIVTLTDAARRDLHQLVGRGLLGKPRGRLFEIANECNIKDEELRMGGPPIDNVAIDEEGSITLVRLIGMCAVIGLGLSFLCFRSITVTMMVFFVGGMSAVICLALVYWSGSSVDAITMSMPALVYVLGLSGAAHIVNYYTEAVTDNGHTGAPETAIRHGWKPALLCNITTAIGLFSLCTSQIVPIRKFGIYSGLGVLATLLILFTFLPAALQIWPQRRKAKSANDGEWMDRYLSGLWNLMGNFCVRYHVLVSTTCILVIASVGYGVVHIKTSVNLLKMFSADAKIIKDYEWLEDNLGQLVPMEVVLSVKPEAQLASAREREASGAAHPDEQFQLSFLERMELANQVQQVVENEFGSQGRNIVGRAMSASTFAPRLPPAKGDTSTFARRGATSRLLETHRHEFLHSDYLRIDKDNEAELWRVSLRLGATKGVDYGEFVKDLKCAVEPVLSAHHCREQVLRNLMAIREGKRPAGASVLLLGMPAGTLDAPAIPDGNAVPASVEDGRVASGLPVAGFQSVNQTKIFTNSLIDLLNVSRLRVRAYAPPTEPGAVDPLPDLLATVDCVVLVGNQSGYDLAALHKQAKLVIDATNHVYDPLATDSSTAMDHGESIAAVYTGVVPIVYKAQRALLESLIESTFWSFITITPLMMLIARSFSAGAVAMLPNVLPVLVVFGGMGWLGIDVDIGSMMTASIALGVAVDDTIHYLNWYREELDRLGDRKLAILAAYKHCATPTFQSAIISGLGLSVFALSTFTPTQRFGYLMLTILWAGVVAELIFFPALLAGPLGLVFKPKKRKVGEPEPHPHVDEEANGQAVATVSSVAAESSKTKPVRALESEKSTTPTPSDAIPASTPSPTISATNSNGNSAQPSGAVPTPNSGRSKSAVMRILRQDVPHGKKSKE